MPTYYHVAPPVLHPGAVIQVGQWGRLSRTFPGSGRGIFTVAKALTLTWEATLEAVRQNLTPAAPSRLKCVFASTTVDDAISFRDRSRPGSAIYEIAPVRADCATFVGDYDLISEEGSDEPLVDEWVRRAISYWTGPIKGVPEVLIGGQCAAIQQVGKVPDLQISSPSLDRLATFNEEDGETALSGRRLFP